MGYDTRGKNIVLYRSNASRLFGEEALREFENWDDFEIRIWSCSLSDRSHDFHIPRYLVCPLADLNFIVLGELVKGSIIIGQNEVGCVM